MSSLSQLSLLCNVSRSNQEMACWHFDRAYRLAVEDYRQLPGSTEVSCEHLMRAYPIAERCFLGLCERYGAHFGSGLIVHYAAWNAILVCFHTVLSAEVMENAGSFPEISKRIRIIGCSDSRLYPGLFGIESEQFYRLPGGRDVVSFSRDPSGRMVFHPESPLGAWVLQCVESGTWVVCLLGHTGCAACRIETKDRPEDARHDEGAFYGFLQQVEMAEAVETFLRERGMVSTLVVPLLYEVELGELFIGLDDFLQDLKLQKDGITSSVLRCLSREGIVSTGVLLQDRSWWMGVSSLASRYCSATFPKETDVRACLDRLLDNEKICRGVRRTLLRALPKFSENVDGIEALRYIVLANMASMICRTPGNGGHSRRNMVSLIRIGIEHGFPPVARALALSEPGCNGEVKVLASVVRGGRGNGSLGVFDRKLSEFIFPPDLFSPGNRYAALGDFEQCPVPVIIANGISASHISFGETEWPILLEGSGNGSNFSLSPI